MIQTKEDLKGLFGTGEVQTEAKMSDLIDSCYNDGVMPDAYEVVTAMPTTIPLGKLVLYNGTLWRGLKSGESTLAEGTPFPVKGYKEIVIELMQISTSAPTLRVIKNDTDCTFTSSYSGVGRYSINNSISLGSVSDIVLSLSPMYNDSAVHWAQANQSVASISVVYSDYSPSYFLISSRDYNGDNANWSSLYETKTILRVKIYPPTT